MRNKMKRSWLIALLFGLTLNTVNAQEVSTETSKMTAEQRADKRTEAVKNKLMLNDGQTKQVREVFLKQAQDRDQSMKMMNKSREQSDKAMSGILNAEQMKKYNEMQVKQYARINEKKEDRNGKVKKDTSLPDTQ